MLIPVKGQAMVEVVNTAVSNLCDNRIVSVNVAAASDLSYYI